MELIDALTVYGPLGIGVFAMGHAILKLWGMYERSQNGRLEDAARYSERILEMSQAHNAQNSENIKTLERAIDVLEIRNG